MLPKISKIKGVHPGAILKREIKLRGIKNKELAHSIDEHAQTISAILNEKRGINPKLSIKLGEQLGVDKDYFMILQASYDVKMAKKSILSKSPNLNKIRKALFWDTDINKIDWDKNKTAVLRRIFERGNEKEIEEIISFYGFKTVKNELKNTSNNFLPSYKENLIKHKIIEPNQI